MLCKSSSNAYPITGISVKLWNQDVPFLWTVKILNSGAGKTYCGYYYL